MPDLHCPFCESRTNFTDVWRFQSVPIGAVQRGWNGQIMEALQCDNSQCQMIIGGILATDGLIHDYWPRCAWPNLGSVAFASTIGMIGRTRKPATFTASIWPGALHEPLSTPPSVDSGSAMHTETEGGGCTRQVPADGAFVVAERSASVMIHTRCSSQLSTAHSHTG